MKIVSIIVPVYNSERFLDTAIASLVEQSYKSIEIILIDDGSQDESGKICDTWAERDERILVIHNENQGICKSRNCGIEHSHGSYIMFCDNDDLYLPETVEKAVRSIDTMNVDFVKYGVDYRIVDEKGQQKFQQLQGYPYTVRIEVSDQFKTLYTEVRESKALTYVWNGIYKTSLIKDNDLLFDEQYKYGGEDFDFNYRCLTVAKSIGFCRDSLYIHFKRENHSTAAKYDRSQIEAVYANLKIEQGAIQRFFGDEVKIWEVYVLCKYCVALLSVLSNPRCTEDRKYIKMAFIRYLYDSGLINHGIIAFIKKAGVHGYNKRFLMTLFLRLRLITPIVCFTMHKRNQASVRK